MFRKLDRNQITKSDNDVFVSEGVEGNDFVLSSGLYVPVHFLEFEIWSNEVGEKTRFGDIIGPFLSKSKIGSNLVRVEERLREKYYWCGLTRKIITKMHPVNEDDKRLSVNAYDFETYGMYLTPNEKHSDDIIKRTLESLVDDVESVSDSFKRYFFMGSNCFIDERKRLRAVSNLSNNHSYGMIDIGFGCTISGDYKLEVLFLRERGSKNDLLGVLRNKTRFFGDLSRNDNESIEIYTIGDIDYNIEDNMYTTIVNNDTRALYFPEWFKERKISFLRFHDVDEHEIGS